MTISLDEVRELSGAADLDLTIFRPEHLEARVARALDRAAVSDVAALTALLQQDRRARSEFRRSVAISVTGFFRDAEQFDLLDDHLGRLSGLRRPRVWSAGCSTGRELWSLAVLLDRIGLAARSFLLGSDLLEENVRLARVGLDDREFGDCAVPERVRPTFEVRNIVGQGPPPGPWNVIACRNLAIYLAPVARLRLHDMLASALAPGGLLLLGRSERLSDARSLGLELVAPHLYAKGEA